MAPLGTQADIDDSIQETWMAALLSLERYDSSRSFHAWLLGIALKVRASRRRQRRQDRRAPLEEALNLHDLSPGPEEILCRSRRRQQVQRALHRMPQIFREVVILHDGHEQAIPVVARQLNAPLNTTYSRLRLGRNRLRRLLSEEMG
jgi:RNA polymerase sigma-70 factor, ECF subfamily